MMRIRIFGRWTAAVVLLAAAVTMSAQTCPTTAKGKKIPSNNWKALSTKAGYYALDSVIINTGNGQVVVGSAPYATVKSYMGSGFNDAIFTSIGSPGTSSQLGPNIIQCTYDGPGFHHSGKSMKATVVVNCTKGAACNF
jgi:hypothetical protein